MHLSPAESSQLANLPQQRMSDTKVKQLHDALRGRIQGDLHTDRYQRALYSTDASLYQIQPLAVVAPRTKEDVIETVKIAAEFGVPIVPRGGGTSLSGQSIVAGVVVDFSKYLNQILELDPESRTARVQPGVVLDDLNSAAATHGLQFGPDVATSSRACIGGMIGNNSAGARSIRYGKTVDHVISLAAILADGSEAVFSPKAAGDLAELQASSDGLGEIYREVQRIVAENRDEIIARYPKIIRRVSGYNLDEFVPECRARLPVPTVVQGLRAVEESRYPGADFNLAKLIVGAEGTLACVTEALVHLVPLPRSRGIVVLHFDSMTAAVASTGTILEFEPSAVELLDGQIVRLAQRSLEYRHYLDFVVGTPESLVLVEFSADTPEVVRERAEALVARLAGTPGLFHILRAFEPGLCNHVWACRKAALPLLMGVPGLRKPIAFVEDAAVDPRRLPEFVGRFHEIIRRAGTDGAFYGHASVGCLHIRPMLDAGNREDLERLERISRAVCDLVLEFEGAMSGEHGDGLARSYLNEKLFGPKLYDAFLQIKTAFDPVWIMNPGKIVNGPNPTANLRQDGEYTPPQLTTRFDFSREGGFLRAAELCNGSGVCRKLRTGTMCPSFMVTGEEEHSTRGRANALRLILSGVLPPEELTGNKLLGTYELCLSCKGCKAECPSNVDAAKLKAEFLEQYHRVNGIPLRTHLMAHVAQLNRIGSALAPVSNWFKYLPGAGWLGERLLGMDRRRPLPTFNRKHFRRWFRKHRRTSLEVGGNGSPPVTGPSRGPIVLLDDCLTSYCEPQVNQAAVRVLEAAGYGVHLAGLKCCGRAAISKGMLSYAKLLAEENIALLLPWAERGIPIVGCEPSCVLTLVDEYPDLVPGAAALQVAGAAALIDSHLARSLHELSLTPLRARAMVHGHCHQKALVGMRETQTVLAAIPEIAVETLDSGCCGMAGSFGYEHYDISMRIGERVLLPAVRDAVDRPIVAPGFSCRQQILHGTKRRALHPIELIAQQLPGAA